MADQKGTTTKTCKANKSGHAQPQLPELVIENVQFTIYTNEQVEEAGVPTSHTSSIRDDFYRVPDYYVNEIIRAMNGLRTAIGYHDHSYLTQNKS